MRVHAAPRVRNGAARVPAAASLPVGDTTISTPPVGTGGGLVVVVVVVVGGAVVVVVVVGGAVVVVGGAVVVVVVVPARRGVNGALATEAVPGPAVVTTRRRSRSAIPLGRPRNCTGDARSAGLASTHDVHSVRFASVNDAWWFSTVVPRGSAGAANVTVTFWFPGPTRMLVGAPTTLVRVCAPAVVGGTSVAAPTTTVASSGGAWRGHRHVRPPT
jgi:hypothetical protein